MQSGYVLIVDDSEVMRSMVKIYVVGLGHRVREAENGAQALKMVKLDRPEMIITDFQMPVMDGIELCRALRADPDPFVFRMPVVMLTDSKKHDLASKAGAAGVTRFIAKSMGGHEIARTVTALIGPRPTAA